jgi:predicted esterase
LNGPHAGQPVVTRGQPLGEGRAVLILLHGRNAGPENILELVASIGHPSVTCLAPAAEGKTWYPFGFMSEIAKNEPGISSGIAVIHDLIDRAAASGVAAERVILLGFSQGACLAATAAIRRPARYGGVIAFSGGLIGPPGSRWIGDGRFERTPVFFGCSDVDSHIPRERVAESAAAFRAMGADVTERIYPGMGHTVIGDEIDFARQLVRQVAES